MNQSLRLKKKRQRDALLKRRQAMAEGESKIAGERVTRLLLDVPWVRKIRHIVAYAAVGNEISLDHFVALMGDLGAQIFYPRYNKDRDQYDVAFVDQPETDFISGPHGIREPRPEAPGIQVKEIANRILWLVPGVAFDRTGGRLGRGYGHYDRMLQGTEGIRIGIGYDWQIIDKVAIGSEDILMQYVVTDRQWVECRNQTKTRNLIRSGDRQQQPI